MHERSAVLIALRSLRRPGRPSATWMRRVLAIAVIWLASSATTAILSQLIYDDHAFLFGEHRLGTLCSVAMLAAGAVESSRVAKRLGTDPFARVWRVGAWALGFFAIDDYFMLHENVDWAIHWALARDPKDPLTDRIDDVIVLAYPLVGAAAAWPWRRELAALPWMLWSLVATMALFSGMAVIDWLDASPAIEESLKIGAGGGIVAAIRAAGEQLRSRSSPDLYSSSIR